MHKLNDLVGAVSEQYFYQHTVEGVANILGFGKGKGMRFYYKLSHE
jgi:hypothetical protein